MRVSIGCRDGRPAWGSSSPRETPLRPCNTLWQHWTRIMIIMMIMIMNVEHIWLTELDATQIKVSSAVAYDFNQLIYAVFHALHNKTHSFACRLKQLRQCWICDWRWNNQWFNAPLSFTVSSFTMTTFVLKFRLKQYRLKLEPYEFNFQSVRTFLVNQKRKSRGKMKGPLKSTLIT